MRCLRINMTFLYLYYPILLINAETNPQRICNKSKLFKAHHTLFYILELYFVKLATVFVLIMCIVKKLPMTSVAISTCSIVISHLIQIVLTENTTLQVVKIN